MYHDRPRTWAGVALSARAIILFDKTQKQTQTRPPGNDDNITTPSIIQL